MALLRYANILILYLAAVNLAAFIMFGADKRRAERKMRRLPEGQLLMAALLGGSLGALLGMAVFRHKTRKPRFYVLVPLFFAAHCALIIWLVNS